MNAGITFGLIHQSFWSGNRCSKGSCLLIGKLPDLFFPEVTRSCSILQYPPPPTPPPPAILTLLGARRRPYPLSSSQAGITTQPHHKSTPFFRCASACGRVGPRPRSVRRPRFFTINNRIHSLVNLFHNLVFRNFEQVRRCVIASLW